MHPLERWCLALRHGSTLGRATWLWAALRPCYDAATTVLGRRGLVRRINGTDEIRLLPRLRRLGETYEPDVWPRLMSAAGPGDVVVDVGALVGLYTLALARRVGPTGRVIAFEPDPESFALLTAQVRLNGVEDRVELVQAAVGECGGRVPFQGGRLADSRVLSESAAGAGTVACVALDDVLGSRRVDVLKVDVEGYEVHVLKGARGLLSDPARRPRALFVEIHPFAWPSFRTSGEELLELLTSLGYEAGSVDGAPARVDRWGELVAWPRSLGDAAGALR
jgi:FkbM family methyltransferase